MLNEGLIDNIVTFRAITKHEILKSKMSLQYILSKPIGEIYTMIRGSVWVVPPGSAGHNNHYLYNMGRYTLIGLSMNEEGDTIITAVIPFDGDDRKLEIGSFSGEVEVVITDSLELAREVMQGGY